ncbi:hypothetical protein G7Z17_g4212 [Cylindrodendrum hubeiense]|uniref:ABM domain-containing protein n=1 Tax=Cylindrodendrum hubeiense TaxID=595255 RepID=A0A9P5LCV2_9HYPO|nr:hypothetical protein G7Z17_g4212 [Cylindrodendrum hubeiense]
MAVTEFALIQLKRDCDKSKFLELFRVSMRIQDQWVRENQPHLLQNKPYPVLSTFVLQNTEPPYLLVTAQWDSPQGHAKWLLSAANKGVFSELSTYVDDVSASVVVFHMDPAGSEAELRGDLFAQEAPFSVCQLSVNSSQRESVQKKYCSIEAQARIAQPSSKVWAGWRIEKDDDEEELVIFWNQGVLDGQLSDLLSTPGAEHEIRQFQIFE